LKTGGKSKSERGYDNFYREEREGTRRKAETFRRNSEKIFLPTNKGSNHAKKGKDKKRDRKKGKAETKGTTNGHE